MSVRPRCPSVARAARVALLLSASAVTVAANPPAVAGEVQPGQETGRPAQPAYRSPQALCLSPDESRLYVANATADTVSVIDVRSRKVVAETRVGPRPCAETLSRDGRLLYVSCSWAGRVDVVDTANDRVVRSIPTGEEPNGVLVSADGHRLFVANVIGESVSVIDAATGLTEAEIPVEAQPRSLAETPDGSRVVVANSLSRSVSIIDTAALKVVERRDLGRATLLRQVACSSDGRYAFVAHLVSHDDMPTLQIERGWIHSNGFSVVDLSKRGRRVTMLLDHLLEGAANPTGLVLSPDDRWLYVSLAGVHEVAIVDVRRCLALAQEAATPDEVRRLQEDVEVLDRLKIARRVPSGGLGPRSLALSAAAGELFVANYFSDSVAVLDSRTGGLKAVIPLGPPQELSLWRRGELLSCDARTCYQHWFSCASCHQEDGTDDGLNWDLANDGLGNPKNAKDLLNAHDTPPAMWAAVRADMDDGIGGGLRFEGFVATPERQAALSEYFGHPERAPNPFRGRNPAAVARGRALFTEVGCDVCHPAPLYTDLKVHDLGLGTPDDYRSRFDTPSLRGCYRTSPYLHDGRAPTLLSVFTEHNPGNLHGRTRGLSADQLDDLVAYVKTL